MLVFHINAKSEMCINSIILTETDVSSNKHVKAFLAALCLASFLFFPTPSGYGFPFTTAFKVNLQKIQKSCISCFKNVTEWFDKKNLAIFFSHFGRFNMTNSVGKSEFNTFS